MYRIIAIFSLTLCFSITGVLYPQSAVAERNWFEQQIIELKVYPYKDKAYEHLKEGKLSEAAVEFAKVLEIDPTDTNVRLDYCQVLYDQRDYTQAKAQALEVLKSHPDNASALMLATSSLQKLGRNAEALDLLLDTIQKKILTKLAQENAFVSAVHLLIKQKEYALLLNILDTEGSTLSPSKHAYILGLAYKGANRLNEALKAYKEALAFTDSDALSQKDRLIALSDIADIYMKVRKFDEAQEILLKAHNIAPTVTSITYRLAELSYETKQYDKALEWINLSLKNRQESTQLLLKAFILEELGRGNESIELFDKLTKTAATMDEKAELFTKKGFVAVRLGNLDMAIEAFEQSLAIVPTAEAMEALATAQGLKGDWTKAIETYKLLISTLELGEDQARAHMELGTAYMKEGNSSKAIAELSKALDSGFLSSENQVSALQNLGFLYYGSKQYSEAKDAFLAALARHPDNDQTLLALGRTQLYAGEYKDAIATFQKLDSANHDFATSMLLAYAYEKNGQHEQAIKIYKTILNSDQLHGDNAMVVFERLATLENLHGKPEIAGELYLKAYKAAEKKKPSLLLRAGESFYAAKKYDKTLKTLRRYLRVSSDSHNFEALSMMGTIYSKRGHASKAAEVYVRALTHSTLSPKQRRTLLINLGYLYIAMDKTDVGIRYMRQAIAAGGETPRLRMDMGLALYKTEKYQEAIKELRRARNLGIKYEADSALSFCFQKLNKPGLALYYLKEAKKCAPASVLQDSAKIYDQLGYLYTSEGSYTESITNYKIALCITPTSLGAYKLGQAQRLAGNLEAAESTLLTVNPEQLDTPEIRVLYYEELGRTYKESQQFEKAQAAFSKGIAEKPNAEGYYLLGQVQESSEDLEGAIKSFQTAVELEPANAYRISLGYAYYKNEQLEKAEVIFVDLQKKDPDYINLVEDLAYITKQLYDNDASVAWFKKSIDNAPYYPEETKKSLRKKTYDFKEEVRHITNRWDVTAFYAYSPDDDNFVSDAQGIQVGVLDNTAGVEVGYIPKKFGFRNGKIFSLIGRVSANRLENGVFDFSAESTQGAAGVRYKPFSEANIALGVERLFKIGEDAEDNTLLRLMGSVDDGWAMQAAESSWNYSFLYAELDEYIQDEKRTVFLIHGRQGWTWNIDDAWLITPHLFATYNEVSPDRNNFSRVEGGPAISFRWLEGEDQYLAYKRDWEILIRYLYGKYTKENSDDYNGLGVTLRLNF
ncbi:MAG: tetratricopeptide repeat protein [Halodesulfovibrio sp.]|uniref:tetratricopeptide repeat protein n=1 Tax=Halodesulfovibrio sp. TaxID=1912772 RepID=UPI00359CF709